MWTSPDALRAFALFLCAKVALMRLPPLLGDPSPLNLVSAALIVAAGLGFLGRRSLGPPCLALALLLRIATTWPLTINHAFFEAMAALVLWWYAAAGRSRRAAIQARLVLQLAILSVFFYSGLHKLAHGYFVSGEYLLRTALLKHDAMAQTLRAGASALGPLPTVGDRPLLLGPIGVALSTSHVLAAVIVSWIIVASELLVPLWVVLQPRYSRGLLLAMQVGIGLVSAECGFAFSAFAAVLLLWPRVPRWAWIGGFAFWTAATAVLWRV